MTKLRPACVMSDVAPYVWLHPGRRELSQAGSAGLAPRSFFNPSSDHNRGAKCFGHGAARAAVLASAAPADNSVLDSIDRRALHRAAVHPDHSVVDTQVVAAFSTPKALIYRDVNGTLQRILTDETELRFVNSTLIYLDTTRDEIKAEAQREIDALIDNAFSDGQACIARYADWYFEWGRSWSFAKEAVIGGVKGLGVNNVQGFSEAARNEVEAYLIRNYVRFVLKPELRNPVIEAGIPRILAQAHLRYLNVLTSIDDRIQQFLAQYTRHLEVIDPLAYRA